MTRAARVTELSESLRLYLADTLACDVKLLANLFESPRSSVVESETELYHVLFARSESVQLALYDLAQDGCRGRVGGCRSVLVGDDCLERSSAEAASWAWSLKAPYNLFGSGYITFGPARWAGGDDGGSSWTEAPMEGSAKVYLELR